MNRSGIVPHRWFAIGLMAVAAALWLAPPAQAAEFDLTRLPEGVTVEVNGSGGTYFGDSMSLTIVNDTDEAVTVVVPVGVQFIPEDADVQTMIAAGGERIVVPPRSTVTSVVKAFCGEMNDRGPISTDRFTVGSRVSGDLLDTVENIHREGRYDVTGQHAVWSRTDGYDVSSDPDAAALTVTSGDNEVSPGEAAAAGLAVAAAGGAAALVAHSGRGGPAPTGRTAELRSGAGAIDVLVSGGARVVQIGGETYVIPPDDLPATADAMVFETKTVDGVEVIDPNHVAVLTHVEDPATETVTASEPVEPPDPTEDQVPPAEQTPIEVPEVVKIDEAERRRIIEWGLKYQHTPEEIQRDIDDRNRQLGGSGTLPGPDVPVVVQLPDGPATVTPAESQEYDRIRKATEEYTQRIPRLQREFDALTHQVDIWQEEEQGVAGRWLAGTWELVQESNRMRDPARYLASQRGCRTAEELQRRDYAKPNPQDHVFAYDRYEQLLAQWQRGPDAQRYHEDCNQVWRDALHSIQEKTDPNATGSTSWMNRPLQKLRELEARREAVLQERRNIGQWESELRRLQREFRARGPQGGGG